MWKRKLLLLIMMMILVGCGDEDRTPAQYTPSSDETSTSADDSTLVPARAVPVRDTAPAPPPAPRVIAFALAPLGAGTLRGSGEAASAGSGTSVSVALAQGARGATYQGAVRQGNCARMGAEIASLVPASVDSLGAGRAAGDVPVPIDSLAGAPHVIVYGRGGRPETCGPIGGAAADATG